MAEAHMSVGRPGEQDADTEEQLVAVDALSWNVS